jgi:hypothetical protein
MAAGETGTTQANIQDWLEMDEGDPEFHLLYRGIFYLFSSALPISLNFPLTCLLRIYFASPIQIIT